MPHFGTVKVESIQKEGFGCIGRTGRKEDAITGLPRPKYSLPARRSISTVLM